ncbi:hypothetical protein J14TS5_50100 [Paenibacillus lautus]|nr:hypothetical protein J14TS5_50100 [Paenibacillus lautus]
MSEILKMLKESNKSDSIPEVQYDVESRKHPNPLLSTSSAGEITDAVINKEEVPWGNVATGAHMLEKQDHKGNDIKVAVLHGNGHNICLELRKSDN